MKLSIFKVSIFLVFITLFAAACNDVPATVTLEVTGDSDIVYVQYTVDDYDDELAIEPLATGSLWTKGLRVDNIQYYSVKF